MMCYTSIYTYMPNTGLDILHDESMHEVHREYKLEAQDIGCKLEYDIGWGPGPKVVISSNFHQTFHLCNQSESFA